MNHELISLWDLQGMIIKCQYCGKYGKAESLVCEHCNASYPLETKESFSYSDDLYFAGGYSATMAYCR